MCHRWNRLLVGSYPFSDTLLDTNYSHPDILAWHMKQSNCQRDKTFYLFLNLCDPTIQELLHYFTAIVHVSIMYEPLLSGNNVYYQSSASLLVGRLGLPRTTHDHDLPSSENSANSVEDPCYIIGVGHIRGTQCIVKVDTDTQIYTKRTDNKSNVSFQCRWHAHLWRSSLS